ncbi:MAG: site-specific integrase [Rikenellaceae bacterium]
MRRTTFSVLFVINKTKLLKNGDAPIILRITVGGKRAEVNIRRGTDINQWDSSKEMIKGRDKKALETNEYIRALKLRALTIHRDLELKGKFFTARLIMNMLFNNEDDQKTILKIFRNHNDECRRLIGIDYVKITVTRFDNCCKYLGWLISDKYNKEDMTLNELDGELVRAFETYLKIERGCAQNTVIRYMKCFKKIINLAIANEWMHHNPFNGIRFQSKEVIKEVLTKDEIERLMQKEFDIDRLNFVRDVFVFCCFTGLAYIDAYNLRPEHITTDNNGDMWIRKAREKTDNMCNIPLLQIPRMILEKYKGHAKCTKKGVLLPVMANQNMNNYLKEIAALCGINKHLTTHTARHSYATVVCLANGVSIENVAKMLGHSDIRMTQHYAKVMDSSIKRDMDKIANVFAI